MCKSNGGIPIAVVATIGTTDYGSIDPVAHISDICRRENLWLHADAAYGCGLLVSQRYRESIRDIHLADSVTVDFHKSFFQPVACGAFFCKNKHALACITYHAEYLNPLSQAEEGTPNLVCKSLQTTRRFDALKLWLTLRTNGPQAIGNAFDKVIDLAKKIYDQHRNDRALEFIHRPELSTLVFRYVSQFTDRECPEIDVNAINQKIRKRLMRSGDLLIASTTWRDQCYLKLTLLNPEATLDEISHALKTIQATGDLISRQSSTLHPLDIVP